MTPHTVLILCLCKAHALRITSKGASLTEALVKEAEETIRIKEEPENSVAQQLHTNINFQKISAAAEIIQKEYSSKVGMVPYHMHGVFPSETLALLSTAMATKVDVLIESGTAFGQNAEMMARFLVDKPVQMYTIDNCETYGEERCQKTSTRLKNFTNLNFIFPGDTYEELPKLLAKHKGDRIGIFIDGPKGNEAADLCADMIKASADVKFCALHDVSPTSGEDETFLNRVKTWERQALLSCEPAWHDRWRDLDVHASMTDHHHKGSSPGLAILMGSDTMPFGVKGDTFSPDPDLI